MNAEGNIEFSVLGAVAAELPCPHSHFYVRFRLIQIFPPITESPILGDEQPVSKPLSNGRFGRKRTQPSPLKTGRT